MRRVDDLGRIVIPKEIRRKLRIRQGDPLLKTLRTEERFFGAMKALHDRVEIQQKERHIYLNNKTDVLFFSFFLKTNN